jgi:4'-phosphopantetheinyl transferase EntD
MEPGLPGLGVRDSHRVWQQPLTHLILPHSVQIVDAFSDILDQRLFPEEAAMIAAAVESRQREFTTARLCARRALKALGLPASPIIPGRGGAPIWPLGVVGSITHCTGYRAAAVARSSDVAAIGVDAEPDAPLPDGVLIKIANTDERLRLERLSGRHPPASWDRLLFSAKESVYKAWYPLTGRRLHFEHTDVAFEPSGIFKARLLVEGALVDGHRITALSGRWLNRGGIVLTIVILGCGRDELS